MSSFGAELRIDANDGNPYTLESFKETYPNGQELWDAAEVWKSDGVLRIRTAPVAGNAGLPPPITEQPPVTAAPAPEFQVADFPSISPAPPSATQDYSGHIKYSEAATSSSHTHYTASISPYPGDSETLSPEAPPFSPGSDSQFEIRYCEHYPSSNEDFETLPTSLWNGTEQFPQPIEDVENGCIDWEAMIQSWTQEQWREFGIKYFYGYVQQSSMLMGAMPTISEEAHDSRCADRTPLDAWGDEN